MSFRFPTGSPLRSRLFWFALGSGATVYVYYRTRPSIAIRVRERVEAWKVQRRERLEREGSLMDKAKGALERRREAKVERAKDSEVEREEREGKESTSVVDKAKGALERRRVEAEGLIVESILDKAKGTVGRRREAKEKEEEEKETPASESEVTTSRWNARKAAGAADPEKKL